MKKIVIVEGIDGSGKTTFCKKLQRRIPGSKLVRLPYPEHHKYNEIRRRLRDGGEILDLMIENASHAINKYVNGDSGKILIFDRSPFSSAAYQNDGKSVESILKLHEESVMSLYGSIYVFLDESYRVCHKRVVDRNLSLEVTEGLDNLRKVSENYSKIYENHLDGFRKVRLKGAFDQERGLSSIPMMLKVGA